VHRHHLLAPTLAGTGGGPHNGIGGCGKPVRRFVFVDRQAGIVSAW